MRAFFLLPLLCVACNSVGIPAFAGTKDLPVLNNRASMIFTVNNVAYEGYGVIPRQTSQTITFVLPKDPLKLMITTCNREEFFPAPQSPFKYNFVPLMYVENLDSCLLTATVITAKGETYRSIIDFVSGETLTATSKCNGKALKRTGVELCQSRAGLIQVLQFDNDVVAVAQDGCAPLKPAFGPFSYQYSMSQGFCAYRFMDKDKKVFRLTTFGYTTIKDVLAPGE
jgi:hypothetical protein